MTKVKSLWTEPYILAAVACAALAGFAGVYFRAQKNLLARKEQYQKELFNYVERVDGQPGISLQDRLDFAERAGLSEELKKELSTFGHDLSFDDICSKIYGAEPLERALNSYRRMERK